jgi:hypothetical protein
VLRRDERGQAQGSPPETSRKETSFRRSKSTDVLCSDVGERCLASTNMLNSLGLFTRSTPSFSLATMLS